MLRLLFFLSLALRLSAQETMIREVADPATDTHVEITALFTSPSPGGYFPVRVKIANNLKSDRSISVAFKSTSTYDDDLKSESLFNFTTEAGKTVTRDIMVPLSPPGGSYGSMSTVTATLGGSLGSNTNSITSEIPPAQPAVLLSDSLYTPFGSSLDSEMAKRVPGRSGSTRFAGKFDPKQLPDDWLAFSGYDSVILTDSDWTNVPPGARNAILSWVRLGGRLMIYSKTEASAPSMGLPEESGFGSISMKPLSSGVTLPGEMVREVMGNRYPPRQSSLQSDYSSAWSLQIDFGEKQFRYALFVIVLIIFGILVGPVNLFVFAKAGQRHRLFITTPIISLAASLILIALIIVQDGFGGSGIRRVLMEVRPDAGLNSAYLHQEQFCRTGVLTGSQFTIDTPVAFSPVQLAKSRWSRFSEGYGGTKGTFDLQPADGKTEASGDWFQSRSEHGHVLSAVISTRGRIEETDAPGSFLSTFEFPIDTLYYLDNTGQWLVATGIQSGKRFSLTPLDSTMVDLEFRKIGATFSKRHRNFFKSVANRPGHFVALTKSAPGIDTNPAIRWKETQTVITGPVVLP